MNDEMTYIYTFYLGNCAILDISVCTKNLSIAQEF